VIRLLFIDLDGTLVHRTDDVSPRTIEALNKAQEAGCTVVICTGRSRFEIEPVAAQWNGHGYAITNNGAVISEWDTGEVLHKVAIPRATVKKAAHIAHDFGFSLLGIGADEAAAPQRVFTDRKFPLPQTFLDEHGHRLSHVSDLREGLEQDLVTLCIFGGDGETEMVYNQWLEQFYNQWLEQLGHMVSVFHAPFSRLDTWCSYVTPAAANKAIAAQKVAEMFNVSREQTMAIGDHLNDLELLLWAGVGVAMGDGHALAKAKADHVTAAFHEDGAAQAIEKFVLQAEPKS
jgi:Cof subfamily protein (haloacid dehalogenase superfamily)